MGGIFVNLVFNIVFVLILKLYKILEEKELLVNSFFVKIGKIFKGIVFLICMG